MGSESVNKMFQKHLLEEGHLHFGEFMNDLSRLIVSVTFSSLLRDTDTVERTEKKVGQRLNNWAVINTKYRDATSRTEKKNLKSLTAS